MRFNNYPTIKYIPFIYFISIISLAIICYLEFLFEKENLFHVEQLVWLVLGAVFTLLLYLYFFGQFFEYDGDGEALCFRNDGIVISERINYRGKKAEFPRTKLKKFKIKNYFIVKKLYIYVKSNKIPKKVTKIVFDITFVKPKRISLMKASLNKVVSKNKK